MHRHAHTEGSETKSRDHPCTDRTSPVIVVFFGLPPSPALHSRAAAVSPSRLVENLALGLANSRHVPAVPETRTAPRRCHA